MSLDQAQNISLEELDKQVLLHPVTSIAEHQDSGPVIYGKSGGREGLRPPGQRLHRRGRGALVRQHRLRADQARRGRGRGNGAHRLLPQLRRRLQRAADPARREATLPAARARRLPPHRQGVSSASPARTGTTRSSSWSATTTTCSAGPRRRRSSPASARTTASPTRPAASPASRSTTRPSTCPSRACCTQTARITGARARTARARRRSRTAWWLPSRR